MGHVNLISEIWSVIGRDLHHITTHKLPNPSLLAVVIFLLAQGNTPCIILPIRRPPYHWQWTTRDKAAMHLYFSVVIQGSISDLIQQYWDQCHSFICHDNTIFYLQTYADWPSYPQLYVQGEFIGGCDIVEEMAANGELRSLLQDLNSRARKSEQSIENRLRQLTNAADVMLFMKVRRLTLWESWSFGEFKVFRHY